MHVDTGASRVYRNMVDAYVAGYGTDERHKGVYAARVVALADSLLLLGVVTTCEERNALVDLARYDAKLLLERRQHGEARQSC